MKIWSASHIFSHPWDTVVQAASRKYPNPMNPNVVGVDVVERQISPKDGVLRSHRLMSTSWGLPDWVIKMVGMEEQCFVSEHSEINTSKKTMKLHSRNLTFSKYVTIDEQLTYVPDPEDPNHRTILKQEATVTVNGVPMTSYCEDMIKGTISNKAQSGRQAMEWVIGKITDEAHELVARGEEGLKAAFSTRGSSL